MLAGNSLAEPARKEGQPGFISLIISYIHFQSPSSASCTATPKPVWQIVDVNFQSGPDTHLDARLLLYNAAYHHHYPVPVRSVVILLRPAADLTRLTGRLAYQEGGSRVEFEYEVIRLWQQPVDAFLTGGLALLPLASLCRLPAGVPSEQAVRDVIHRVDLRLAAEAPYARGAQLMTAAFVLTGMRVSGPALDDVFRGAKVMHESSAFTLYEEKGRRERATESCYGRAAAASATDAVTEVMRESATSTAWNG